MYKLEWKGLKLNYYCKSGKGIWWGWDPTGWIEVSVTVSGVEADGSVHPIGFASSLACFPMGLCIRQKRGNGPRWMGYNEVGDASYKIWYKDVKYIKQPIKYKETLVLHKHKSFTRPHVITNLYGFLFLMKHKRWSDIQKGPKQHVLSCVPQNKENS